MAHFIMRRYEQSNHTSLTTPTNYRTLDAPDVDFNNKLHIVYLINDLVHHWYVIMLR